MLKWNGTGDEFIKAFAENDYELLSKFVQDNSDYIAMLTAGDMDLNLLDNTLKYGFLMLDEFKDQEIDDDLYRNAIFEIGCLYGLMQLSSQICYEKKKDARAFETALSMYSIKHFNDVVAALSENGQLTHSQLCWKLNIKASTLSECMKKVLMTGLVERTRVGKYKVYTLSDDGLRYSKQQQKELSRQRRKQKEILDSIDNRPGDYSFDVNSSNCEYVSFK